MYGQNTLFTVLGLVTLVAFAPKLAYADQRPNNSTVSFGEKLQLKHDRKTISGPAIKLDENGIFHMAWIQANQNDLITYYLQTNLKQKTFPQPIRVNPGNMPAASVHEPPALALGKPGKVYLTWTTPHPNANGKLFTSLLLLSRSLDGGHTFLPPIRINDDKAVTGHSFDYVTVSPNGSVHIVWLDAREGKKDPATYSSFSQDQGQTFSPNLKIDDTTCVCCRTHATTASDGTVYLAWRKIFTGNIRETVVARSSDNGKTYSPSVIVGHDRWAFEGCPHRPATMGTDREGRLYITWYTEGPDDTPGVYLAYSDDQGKHFSPRRQINVSKGTFPDHPQLAVNNDGKLLVTWEEQSPVRREVVFSYSLDRGQTFSPPQKLNKKKAKHPSVTINPHGHAVLAWHEQIHFPSWSTVVQPIVLPDIPTPSLGTRQTLIR